MPRSAWARAGAGYDENGETAEEGSFHGQTHLCPALGVEKAVEYIASREANLKAINFYVIILYN